MSNSTLHDVFERIIGQSTTQYLHEIRLHQARTMIVSSGLSAGEVVYKAGCNNATQFSRECKRQFGLPSGWADEIP